MTFFSLFLGVQSAPEVGATSYETPCIHIYIYIYIYLAECRVKATSCLVWSFRERSVKKRRDRRNVLDP